MLSISHIFFYFDRFSYSVITRKLDLNEWQAKIHINTIKKTLESILYESEIGIIKAKRTKRRRKITKNQRNNSFI